MALLTGEAASSALAFVITILLARRLTDEGFGRLAFVQAMMVYFTLFMDMGLATFGAREIARNPQRTNFYVGAIFGLRLILATIVAIPFAVAVYFWPLSMEMRWLCWGSALALFTQALNPEFAFQGSEKMSGIAAWRVLVHAFQLLLIVVLVMDREQLRIVPLLRFAAEALTLAILAAWFFRRGMRPHFAWLPGEWRRFLKESMVMAASLVVIKLYYTFDTFMLGIIDQPEAVGWYNAAYKIILLFIGLASLIQTVFAPHFSRSWNDYKVLDYITQQFGQLLFFIASLISGLLILFKESIIISIFGMSYIKASAALELLAISMFFVFLCTIWMAPLLYIGKQKYYFRVVTTGAIANIFLNLLLIPSFSFRGAAWATILSNAIIFILGLHIYVKHTEMSVSLKKLRLWILSFIFIFFLMPFIITTRFLIVGYVFYFIIYIYLNKNQILMVLKNFEKPNLFFKA